MRASLFGVQNSTSMPRPGELGQVPGTRRERARPGAAADEQDRRRRRLRDRRAHRPEPLVAPALGEADDEQARALGRPQQAAVREVDEDRLGLDPGQLLDDERGGAEHAARVAVAVRGVAAPSSFSGVSCAVAIQAASSSAAQSWSPPPKGTITGCWASIAGMSWPLDEHGDVARRLLEHLADGAARNALAEQRPPAVEQHEVDLLLRGEAHVVLPGQDAREGERPGGDAALGRALRAFSSSRSDVVRHVSRVERTCR